MMSFWRMRRLPHTVRFIIFCNLLICLNANLNDTTSNEEQNFGDNNPSLKRHYDMIFDLIEKSIFGEKIIRLEDKELPIQVIGCVPGDQMIVASFPIHKRSKIISGPDDVCSAEIDVGAIIDFINARSRLKQFDSVLGKLYSTDAGYVRGFTELYGHEGVKIGIYLIDDCSDESLAMDILSYVKYWTHNYKQIHKNQTNPCLLHPSNEKNFILGFFSSFPSRSFNSTFASYGQFDLYTAESTITTTKREVQHFSFETFKDSYIVCSILRHFEWTRVGLVYDTRSYINHFINKFAEIAGFFNICTYKLTLDNAEDDTTNLKQHEDFFRKLMLEEINVFVIFCPRSWVFQDLVRMIENISRESGSSEKIFITGADSLPPDIELMQTSNFLVFDNEAQQVGNDSIYDGKSKLIQEYLMKNETLNSTYEKYWSKEFECNFPENEFAFVQNETSNDKENGEEFPDSRVSSDLKCRRTFLSKLDEIVYEYAHNLCLYHQNKTACSNTLEKILMQLSTDNSWLTSMYTIKLNIPGNIPIGNGTWDNTTRRIIFQTQPDATNIIRSVKSKCSTTSLCKFGQKEKISSINTFCCLVCEDCQSNQIVIWNECLPCLPEEWPNENRTVCIRKKIYPLQWDNLEIVICVTYSTIIILMVATTLWIFIKNRDTPVVKASTRELSFIMLVAMIAVESAIFIFMSRPEKPRCDTIHLVSSLSFGTIYAGLFVRTVRIARLLAMSKNEFPQLNMKCMSTKSQVAITVNVIIVELILVLLMLYNAKPLLSTYRDYIDPKESLAPMMTPVCRYDLNSFAYNFSFVFGLIALCTGCAVWVRKVPDNFNETKYIGFCMYATCLTWTAFGFTLFGQHNYEVLALYACFSTNNLLALIFLFFPKLYIIIFKPEKNHRRYFNTSSENMRVHKKSSRKTKVLLKNLDKTKN